MNPAVKYLKSANINIGKQGPIVLETAVRVVIWVPLQTNIESLGGSQALGKDFDD